MSRRSAYNFNPEESEYGQHDGTSIICQIPMNYHDYHEKKVNSTKAADKIGSKPFQNPYSHNNLKISTDTEPNAPLDPRAGPSSGGDTTPIFNANGNNQAQEKYNSRSSTGSDSQEKYYKRLVELAFQYFF